MSARPLIGVICCTRMPEDPVQGVAERYLKAVPFIGADAVLVPSTPRLNDVRRVLGTLDGIMLTGSPSNIEPIRYGGEAPGEGPFDPARDAHSMSLIDLAIEMDKPLLGICRGFQEISVRFGSSLRKDLGEPGREQVHHTPPGVPLTEMFGLEHPIALTSGGILERALGGRSFIVNSAHFQGIETLGPGLLVEAVSADGIIEAIRPSSGARVLGLQWHPEWRVAENKVSQRLFALFGLMLRGASLEEAATGAARQAVAPQG